MNASKKMKQRKHQDYYDEKTKRIFRTYVELFDVSFPFS